jgi:hypothetical protein
MACDKENFDYIIKKNDTRPYVKYSMQDCEDIDLSEDDLFISVNMWANSNIKNKLSETDDYLELKNNYNLETIKVDDYILIKKFGSSEHFQVTSISDTKVYIQRGQLNSVAQSWARGSEIKIIKLYEVEAEKEIEYNTTLNIKGEEETVASSQNLLYKWSEGDTSSSGMFFLEFKVSKVDGEETLWTKKVPSNKEGISIKITNNSLEV